MSSSETSSFPAETGEPAGPTYEEAAQENRIIVLIVGETQHGKSTLIKQIGRYAKSSDLHIRIGNGNGSCTTAVGQYNFSIPLHKYKLLDNLGKPFTEKTVEALSQMRTAEAIATREPETEGSTRSFTFIDTPGLNDSGGDDMDLMAGIISKVSSLHHLNAIIYVRSVHGAFSASFRKFFSYIQRSMPSISEGMIIAHTRFTVKETLSRLQNNISFSALRRDAFKAATNLDTCHFFMDNDPNPGRPFEVVQSMNEIYRLLLFIRGQKAVSTSGLRLLKTDKMLNMDAYLKSAIGDLRRRLENRWNAEVYTAKDAKQKLYRKIRDVSNKRTLLNAHQEEIRTLLADDTIVLGTQRVDKPLPFFDMVQEFRLKRDPEPVTFKGDYAISEVRKTLGPGCKWQNEHQHGHIWEGTLSASRLTDMEGSVTWYTNGALKYAEKLSVLNKECARLEGQLELLNEGFDNTSDELEDENDVVSTLKARLDTCVSLLSTLDKETFQMELYPKLKHIYLLESKPQTEDIVAFIEVYNQDLGDVYRRGVIDERGISINI